MQSASLVTKATSRSNIVSTKFIRGRWMSSRQESIKAVFENLLQDNGIPGQRVHKRIDQSAPIKIHAACVFPHKNLMLEIGPIKNAWLPQGFKRPRIKGLSVALKTTDKIYNDEKITSYQFSVIHCSD